MKTYTVFWQYGASSGTMSAQATTEMHACRRVVKGFSPRFGREALICAVEGVHVFKKASGLAEVEVLATRNSRAIIGTAVWYVDQDKVTDEDWAVWLRTKGGTRAFVETSKIDEFLPE